MANYDAITRENLLHQIETDWNALLDYLSTLSPEQLTRAKDASGWTAKDHLAHIAAWEAGAVGLLEGRSKRETMGIEPETWAAGDDPINATLQQRDGHLSLDEVMQTLRDTHERLVARLSSMTEAELQLPYSHYQPGSSDDHPIKAWLPGDTYHHYRDHLPWIAELVEQGAGA